MLTAEKLIGLLNLEPLQNEGGFFRETWRSVETIPESGLPERYNDKKSVGTAIYYLLTRDTKSKIHRLPTDEIWHFYLGDPVELLLLFPDGRSEIITLGQKIDEGELVQAVIPEGTWFGARLKPMDSVQNQYAKRFEFALMGTTMAPGFDFTDFESGNIDILLRRYKDRADIIEAFSDEV